MPIKQANATPRSIPVRYESEGEGKLCQVNPLRCQLKPNSRSDKDTRRDQRPHYWVQISSHVDQMA